MGAAGLDDEAAVGVSKSNARRLRSRKHFGNASPHFLEETAAAKENQQRNRATASCNSDISSANKANHANSASASRGRSVNLKQSTSRRRVFTLAICPSKRPRAISS